jgi:hypothetical protein
MPHCPTKKVVLSPRRAHPQDGNEPSIACHLLTRLRRQETPVAAEYKCNPGMHEQEERLA